MRASFSAYKGSPTCTYTLPCEPRGHADVDGGCIHVVDNLLHTLQACKLATPADEAQADSSADVTLLVQIALEELKIPYKAVAVDLHEKHEHKSEWFLKINPNGRIPAIGAHLPTTSLLGAGGGGGGGGVNECSTAYSSMALACQRIAATPGSQACACERSSLSFLEQHE